MPIEDRELRMQLFASFAQQVEAARGGAMDQVSEVDLTEAKDLRATITGLQSGSGPNSANGNANAASEWSNADAPVLIHFGDSDFEDKFLTVLKDVGRWRAEVGNVESVDLRFNGEAVVNQDPTLIAKVEEPPAAAAVPRAVAAANSKPVTTSHGAAHATLHTTSRATSHGTTHANSHSTRRGTPKEAKKNGAKHSSAAGQQ
jgi:hypothetical protein